MLHWHSTIFECYPVVLLNSEFLVEYAVFDFLETGVDIVLDSLNGADAVKGYELLKPLGKIIHFGIFT